MADYDIWAMSRDDVYDVFGAGSDEVLRAVIAVEHEHGACNAFVRVDLPDNAHLIERFGHIAAEWSAWVGCFASLGGWRVVCLVPRGDETFGASRVVNRHMFFEMAVWQPGKWLRVSDVTGRSQRGPELQLSDLKRDEWLVLVRHEGKASLVRYECGGSVVRLGDGTELSQAACEAMGRLEVLYRHTAGYSALWDAETALGVSKVYASRSALGMAAFRAASKGRGEVDKPAKEIEIAPGGRGDKYPHPEALHARIEAWAAGLTGGCRKPQHLWVAYVAGWKAARRGESVAACKYQPPMQRNQAQAWKLGHSGAFEAAAVDDYI